MLRRTRIIVGLAVAFACLVAADIWLLGEIHRCKLWLTREQDLEERQDLESRAKSLGYTLTVVNLAALGLIAIFGVTARSRHRKDYASASHTRQ